MSDDQQSELFAQAAPDQPLAPAPEDARVVGVGPWEGEWPEGEHWDEELLR